MKNPAPADLVIELLKTLDEALTDFVPWTDGGGVKLMPSAYREGSYIELETRLREMRDGEYHREWWHISERYLWGKIKRSPVRTRKTVKGRIPILPPRSELEIAGESIGGGLQVVQYYTWRSTVDPKVVERGIARLVLTMYDGDTTQLRLPNIFLWRLLGIERGDHGQSHSRHISDPSLVAP